jgi:hypothetical protein
MKKIILSVFMLISIISCKTDEPLVEKPKPPVDPNAYTTILSGKTYTSPLVVTNENNILIENCIFKDISAYQALQLTGCSKIMVKNCSFENIASPGDGGKVLWINNSTDVIVDHVTIKNHTSTGHPSAILMDGGSTKNITIQNCNISFVSGNGIASGGTSTVDVEPGKSTHDVPNTGLKVLNNLIHDTGLSPDMTNNSPKHGMYIKAQDCLVEGNIVYDCYDGQGLSIRSTGVVRGNTVYNFKSGPFSYWAQKPAGISQKLIVENNVFYQNKNLTSGGVKDDKDVRLLAINSWDAAVGFKYDDFTVRFNTVIMYGNVSTITTIPVISVGSNYNNVKVYGNIVVDLRTVANTPKYLSVYWSSLSTSTLAKNSSNYTVANLNDFVSPTTFDFHLKSTSGARGYANSETEFPTIDKDSETRSATVKDAGAYVFK